MSTKSTIYIARTEFQEWPEYSWRTWTKMDPSRPKWTKMVVLRMHFDQNGRLLGPFWTIFCSVHFPTVPRPLPKPGVGAYFALFLGSDNLYTNSHEIPRVEGVSCVVMVRGWRSPRQPGIPGLPQRKAR